MTPIWKKAIALSLLLSLCSVGISILGLMKGVEVRYVQPSSEMALIKRQLSGEQNLFRELEYEVSNIEERSCPKP